ncbi:3052_t:CDS:2, partial [Dentiscutata erythropus]
YYHNPHKGYCKSLASAIIKDPTRGALQRVEKIVLKLSDFVNPALVIMVIDAIKKNIPEKREINKMWKYNVSSRKTEHLFLNKMLEIICVFLVGHLTITFPYKGTINDIFDHIQKTFGIHLDFHQIRYTNVVGDLIDLKGVEDWRVAKWEAVRWHNGRMVLQIGNYM